MAERLPKEPFKVGPGVLIDADHLDWQPGQYGGTLHTAGNAVGWHPDVFIMTNEPLLMAPGISSKGIIGNVLKDYAVNEDNTVFTFTMREGLRWSDGMPVTTEDIRFAYEDVLQNELISPVFPVRYRTAKRPDGEPMTLEILDDYTFVISFPEPYGGFLTEITIARWSGYTEILKPSHYLKQFHIDYTPLEEMRAHLDEQELEDDWWRLFILKDVSNWDLLRPQAIGYPVLFPWMRVPGPSGQIVMERNPYFWKVDTEGQQLPYIDRVQVTEVTDIEMVTMKTITGEVDYLRTLTALPTVPVYRQNEERAGYETWMLDYHVDPTVFFLNYTYPDPVWQEVTRDIRFRKALTLAIDRQEIIDSVYFGLAVPTTTVPSEFDPDKARELLNEMGLDRLDEQGYRIGPDGQTFELFIEYSDEAPDFIPIVELLVEHFREVGIYANSRRISRELRGQKATANELQATLGWTHTPLWQDGSFPDYLPGNWGWGRDWLVWFESGGTAGSKPWPEMGEVYDIDGRMLKAVPHSPEHVAAVEELFQWHYDQIPIFILVEEAQYPMIVSTRLRNVANRGFSCGANYAGEQFFFVD